MDDYLGMVRMFAGTFVPRTFMSCNGQLLSVNSNTALFAILGTTFGGNGQTTFGLPNLAGRGVVGTGATNFGAGTYVIGQSAGTITTTLTIPNLPAHNHAAVFTGGGSSVTIPAPTIKASSAVGTAAAPSTAANTLGQLVVPRSTGVALYNNSAPDTDLNVGGVSSSASLTPNGTVTVGVTGSNTPISIVNPYVALTMLIVVQGLYPSRN
ncbi:phage tail protein [Pedobacter sp. N23S346]|uniref:phage tail protein n=1 Tax=Pedobacter sp. N23S346 TaxID=3402750 RepID=UPI003ACA3943